MDEWTKQLLVTATTGLVGVTLAACSTGGTENTTASSTSDETLDVGILQFMEHDSLTSAAEGFVTGLEDAGYVQGENLNVELLNAQGDQANLQTMSEQLSEENDLILAIATPAAQSLATANLDIPVLFTAVTDPVDAGLVESLDNPGGNITGTSDQMPVDKQIELLLSLTENPESIGVVYNSAEANSKIQGDQAVATIEAAGLETKVVTVTSTNDVQQNLTSIANDIQGLYIPTDNTLASTATTVGEIAKEYQIPVVTGAAEQVESGALASYTIDYNSLGKQTAAMAAKIIEGEDPATMTIEIADELGLVVNEDMANALGIDPASFTTPE